MWPSRVSVAGLTESKLQQRRRAPANVRGGERLRDPGAGRGLLAITALARSWWMMPIRGGFAILFGLTMFLWSDASLGGVVVLFGVYALVDGAWAVAIAVRGSDRRLDGWPVGLEGLLSIALGALALAWPLVSRGFVELVVAWGLLTGVLEIMWATRLPRESSARQLYAIGGVSSLFLAVVIWMLPQAGSTGVVWAIGAYAGVFGVVLCLVGLCLRRRRSPTECPSAQ